MKNLLALTLQNKHITQSIFCQKSAEVADIYLKGIIHADYGVGAADLRGAFNEAAGADVLMHVNSPGGDVFEGREMQAVIAGYPGKVTAIIEGLAASAATFVAMSCAEVSMLKGSRFMIHNGMTMAFGNKAEMKAAFDMLASFDIELAAEYAAKTNGDVAQMTAWMDAETWFNADQALEHGFINKINSNSQNMSALSEWDLSAYANAPARPAKTAPEPLPAPEHITQEHREFLNRKLRLSEIATHQ